MRAAQAISWLSPQRSWRVVRIGPLAISTPPDWGDFEHEADDSYVLHNRPRRFRIDGDAVWYGSAIELRIARRTPGGAAAAGPAMTETNRTIICRSGPIFLTLAIANGVAKRQRRKAFRVLESATADAGQAPVVWAVPSRAEERHDEPVFHSRISGPIRR
jgi:hypothetical protein